MPLPGIWLDPDTRAILPDGMEWRGVGAKGLALTKRFEGFKSHPYNDPAGYCTIGYGHLVKKARCDGSEPRHFIAGLSEPRASDLLMEDMRRAEYPVITAVSVKLTDAQYDALCDFVFNVGGGNFKRSTLLAVINAGEFYRVPGELRRWVLANGETLSGLVKRREREIDLFFEGLPHPRATPREGEDLTPIDVGAGEDGLESHP